MLSERDRKYLVRAKKEIIGNCTKCRGLDYKCSCLDTFRLEFKKVKANIAAKYRSFTLDQITHPQTIEARAKVGAYLNKLEQHLDNGYGLFLYGSTGLAKTGIASIVLIESLKLGKTGYFSTLDQCVDLYTGGWKDEDKKAFYQELILDTDVLVLDEVGNETRTNTNLTASCLNDILRRRSSNLQTTIMTSNLFFKKVRDVYGDEVFSILNECTTPIEFNGIDFRTAS